MPQTWIYLQTVKKYTQPGIIYKLQKNTLFSGKNNRLALKFNASFTHKVSVLCHFYTTVYYLELFTKCKYLQNYQILSHLWSTHNSSVHKTKRRHLQSHIHLICFFLSFLSINYLLITHKVSALNLDLFTNCKEIHSTWNYSQSAKQYTLSR